VTCFERAGSAGGIWRDVPRDDVNRNRPENKALMYDDMLCNTPKELMEYYDYTFDEHFSEPTSAFLSRKDMLSYIIARNSKNGALDDVKFSHTVDSVKYNDEADKFSIKYTNNIANKTITKTFDKCIWASGINGKPDQPEGILQVLSGFNGKVLHSVEAHDNFDGEVKGKRILIIGGGYSAEDLALRALTLDVSQVYIAGSTGDVCMKTASWPHGKVTMINGLPYEVLNGTGFKCQAVVYDEVEEECRRDETMEIITIESIDIVIMATGYVSNMDYLESGLQLECEEEGAEWSTRKSWKMDENTLTPLLGNIKPSECLGMGNSCYIDVYRCMMIENPSMMFILETEGSLSSILDLDVSANLVMGYLVGDLQIPKNMEEMIAFNRSQLEAEMHVPYMRLDMDCSYINKVKELDKDHWFENHDDERTIALNEKGISLMIRKLARDMNDCNYGVDLGSWDKLSNLGEKLVEIVLASSKLRTCINQDTDSTFRDDINDSFASIFTGTKSCQLPAK